MRKAPILNAATADRIEAHTAQEGPVQPLYRLSRQKSRGGFAQMETMKIRDREYPVLGTVAINGHSVPVLSIKMMSDERERELSRKEATA